MTLPQRYLEEFSEPDHYLDFAGTGPVSRAVIDRVHGALEGIHSAAGVVWDRMLKAEREATERLARLLGVDRGSATLTPSTSFGLFATAFGLPGGNVVVPSHEFPGNLYPWLRAEQLGRIEVRLVEVPDGRVTPNRLAPAVDGRTVAVALSLVDFRTGFRVDLAGMREVAPGALLVVDAMQAVGAIEVDLGTADVAVAAGHKWLRAGWGTGMMVVSKRALDRLEDSLTGWYGVDDHLEFDLQVPHEPRPGAARFQMGTPPAVGWHALAGALEVLERAGIRMIEKTLAERVLELEEAARRAGAEILEPWRSWEERAGILGIRLPDEPSPVTAERLRSAGFTLTERSGWIRLAPHATTPAGVGDDLAAALTRKP